MYHANATIHLRTSITQFRDKLYVSKLLGYIRISVSYKFKYELYNAKKYQVTDV